MPHLSRNCDYRHLTTYSLITVNYGKLSGYVLRYPLMEDWKNAPKRSDPWHSLPAPK